MIHEVKNRLNMNYFKHRVNAFGYAFSGVFQSFSREPHLKLHAIIAILVIGLGFFFDITVTEWILVLAAVTLVIGFEMFNSALEKLCNIVMPDLHPQIKYIKDVSAGAVLVACIFAVITGLAVFLPYFMD